MPERMSAYMPERSRKYVRIDRMPERMSEYMPERMSDRMSVIYIYIQYMGPDRRSETFRNYVRIMRQGGDYSKKVIFCIFAHAFTFMHARTIMRMFRF
jgi:hypothetical protein